MESNESFSMSSTKTQYKKTFTRNKLLYGAQVSSYSMKDRYYLILHLGKSQSLQKSDSLQIF